MDRLTLAGFVEKIQDKTIKEPIAPKGINLRRLFAVSIAKKTAMATNVAAGNRLQKLRNSEDSNASDLCQLKCR
uniref:Uncharacterized protein n=1 Tax=Romanomermis culicivorax TaxID=13658 RepID=A0A915JJ70_ROMCU